MNHHKFSKLRDAMSPERRAANAAAAEDQIAEIILSQLREVTGQTQREVASTLSISQPSLAQMEKQDDMQISTLLRLVTALGGTLDLVVRLPQGEFHLTQFGKSA